MKRNKLYLFTILIAALALVIPACGGSSGGGGGSVTCATLGPGSAPISGSGTDADPYIISLGVSYGGCAPAQRDPGPLYGIELLSAGTYTITQTNGVTDLELWIYTAAGTLIGVIDAVWGGYTESDSTFLNAGRYGIYVYNNGAPGPSPATGSQDGPFTLTVTGPV